MTRPRSLAVVALLGATSHVASAHEGYYRMPALHQDVIVFCAEGDLWRVGVDGGVAHRLTTHLEEETNPAISPDGSSIAYCASYEGPTEVYTMPIDGGVPVRRTFGGERVEVCGWTADGRIVYASRHGSTLPESQVFLLDPDTNESDIVPLAQAAQAALDGTRVAFTRYPFQGSATKRYRGGTARELWIWGGVEGVEAQRLTDGAEGEAHEPMWHRGRVVFASDRTGTMNLWSMEPDGSDLRALTVHEDMDVKGPSLSGDRVVYQLGADLHVYDFARGHAHRVPIEIASDLEQSRVRWLDDPSEYISAAHLSPDGDRLAITARGDVFVFPVGAGRRVHAARGSGVRHRQARFMPDGDELIVLSDASGEVELWTVPANGIGESIQRTEDGTVFRADAVPSPDGAYVAYQDKDQALWTHDLAANERRLVARGDWNVFADLTWTPDGTRLAYVEETAAGFGVIMLHDVATGTTTALTSSRVSSRDPVFSPDGEWLWFVSERHLESIAGSPWGLYEPQPYFDRTSLVYGLPLGGPRVSPFRPKDELADDETDSDAADDDAKDDTDDTDDADDALPAPVALAVEGLRERLVQVPLPPGHYRELGATADHLYVLARDPADRTKRRLQAIALKPALKPEATTVAERVTSWELSNDRSKLLIRRGGAFFVVDATGGAATLEPGEHAVDLGGWRLELDPVEERRHMFTEAWRLERDYFYDPGMHGLDWEAVRDRYLPLVDRVATRAELSDLIAEMVGELSALHIYVVGGDFRDAPESIGQGDLGAVLARDAAAGGMRIERIYRGDEDFPGARSPLSRPDLGIADGDVITHVNGVAVLETPHFGSLLRGTAGRQVRLRLVRPADTVRDVIVEPIGPAVERDLRYTDWERQCRERVERWSGGQLGYVHLRSMGGGEFARFARDYYPAFDRPGLVIDVRHNSGGNIDSWILGRLMRRAWMYWQGRAGKQTWNMQSAFRGRMIILCNAWTRSDGEAVCEGFRRLGLGPVLGTRTWGGEIWLSFSNRLVDAGIASAAEFGVYGPEGEWLIEGHGVEPDLVVDNLPHATFRGEDAQLRAAVDWLLGEIDADPNPVPPPPAYPDKSDG